MSDAEIERRLNLPFLWRWNEVVQEHKRPRPRIFLSEEDLQKEATKLALKIDDWIWGKLNG